MPEGRQPGQFGRVEIPVEFTKKNLQRSGEIAKREASRIWKEAGGDASRAFIQVVEERFKRDMGDAKEALARGLIDEQEFKKQANRAGQAFDDAILRRIEELATSGEGAQHEMADLANRLKMVGREAEEATDKGIGGFRQWKAAIGAVVAFFATSRIVRKLRDWGEAGVELGRSYLQLQASAKLFGVEQAELNRLSEEGVDKFALSVTVSNQLAASTAKLANRAEQASKSQELMNRALDLGAANGMAADEVARALEQTLRGLDEGTDKLLQRNPSDIYREYAASLDRTAGSLTDVERKQALVNAIITEGTKVSGEYARFLESDIGRLTRWEQLLQRAREEIGTALIPLMAKLAGVMEGPLQVGVNIFTDFLDRLDRMTNRPLENLISDLQKLGAASETIARLELANRRLDLISQRQRNVERGEAIRAPVGVSSRLGVGSRTGEGDLTGEIFDLSGVSTEGLLGEVERITAELESLADAEDEVTAADAARSAALGKVVAQITNIIQRREEEKKAAEELLQVEQDLETLRSGGTVPDRSGASGGGESGSGEAVFRPGSGLSATSENLRILVGRIDQTREALRGARIDRSLAATEEAAKTAAQQVKGLEDQLAALSGFADQHGGELAIRLALEMERRFGAREVIRGSEGGVIGVRGHTPAAVAADDPFPAFSALPQGAEGIPEDVFRLTTDRIEETGESFEQAGIVAVSAIGGLAQAAIEGEVTVQQFMAALGNIGAAGVGGIWGAVIGTGAGLLGSLFGGDRAMPVRMTDVDDRAARKLTEREKGPEEVRVFLVGADGSQQELDSVRYNLRRRESLDGVARIPR